jgi:hypothetical protein
MHIELLWRSRSRSFKNRGDGVGVFVYRLQPHYGSGIDSVSNRNEYQEYLQAVKAAGV